MENREADGGKRRTDTQENRKVQIEVVRHRDLLTILRNPRMTWKAILSLFLVLVILFFGLAFVTLAIKSIYPYNSISTTKYGATIIKSEDKEVIYWLFNTADLWANSGIEVHKNDVISVRASGKSNNAIHHLVNDCMLNREPEYEWTGPEGSVAGWKDAGRNADRDEQRRKFRIAPGENEGVLLMQVIPERYQNREDRSKAGVNNFFSTSHTPPQFVDGNSPDTFGRWKGSPEPDIYVIGAGKNDQVIRTDGILHFAVNDVALTERKIDAMKKKTVYDELSIGKVYKYSDTMTVIRKVRDTVTFVKVADTGKDKDELDLYREINYVDAWFADNVGSFLIVIERKR